MSIQNEIKNSDILEDKCMENVEAYRTNGMVNEKVNIPDQINNIKQNEERMSIYDYVRKKSQAFGFTLIQLSVEILMFLCMFSYVLRNISSTSMIIDKVCLVHLKYDEDICRNLKDFESIKAEVEKMANNYHLGHSFLQMMPPVLLSLFIGSWSDKYGRKLPITVALIGIILDGFGSAICAYFTRSRVEYFFIPAVFTGFLGGFISVFTVLFSYASDITGSGKRTMKYAYLEAAFGISIPMGSFAGGWIFKYFGYTPVFLTSTCGHIVALCWVIFLLEETRGLDSMGNWMHKFRNFWSLDSFVASFKATAQKRPNKGNVQLWLLALSMSIAEITSACK